jgi:hypothetical protein
MTLNVSVGELLESLGRKIAFHREQAASHAREEELHRGQRTLHETELELATRHFEALKAAAVPAAELASSAPAPGPAAEPVEDDADIGSDPKLTTLISRILRGRTNGEPFGPAALTQEIHQRFNLDADVRSVSAALRRMCRKQQVRLIHKGGAHREALYAKGPNPRP